MLSGLAAAAVPAVAQGVANTFGSVLRSYGDRAAVGAATGEGVGNTGEYVAEIQRKFGVSPQQAAAIADEVMQKSAGQQQKMTRDDTLFNAALQTRGGNIAAQRGAILDAQAQQANLANNLINSMANARTAASNAFAQGVQAAGAANLAGRL